MTIERYFRTSEEFNGSAFYYLKAWNKHNDDLFKLICLLLDEVPTRTNLTM
jgi:hypothetical protein